VREISCNDIVAFGGAGRLGERKLSVSTLEYDRGGPCALVSLAGQAGIADCAWGRLLLELPAARGQGRVVVDLSGLSYMDLWVALILLWAGRVISRRGGTLVLASPQPAVERLLRSVGANLGGQVLPPAAGPRRQRGVTAVAPRGSGEM
jgi:anti-anti-sigma factor